MKTIDIYGIITVFLFLISGSFIMINKDICSITFIILGIIFLILVMNDDSK